MFHDVIHVKTDKQKLNTLRRRMIVVFSVDSTKGVDVSSLFALPESIGEEMKPNHW